MYLRHFVADKNKETIYAFNKIDDKVIKNISIMNVAQEKYFYDFPIDSFSQDREIDVEEQLVEKIFSGIEGDMSKLLRKIISKFYMTPNLTQLASTPIFDETDRGNMSLFVVLLLLRTRHMRSFLTEISEKAMTAYAKFYLPSGTLRNLKLNMESSAHSLNHAQVMFDEELLYTLALIISQYNWYIGVNTSPHSFYTSDNPVVVFNHRTHELVIGGVAQSGTEIVMPLNSKLILIIRHPSICGNNQLLENHFVNLEPDATEGYNTWQVVMSQRMIFVERIVLN